MLLLRRPRVKDQGVWIIGDIAYGSHMSEEFVCLECWVGVKYDETLSLLNHRL